MRIVRVKYLNTYEEGVNRSFFYEDALKTKLKKYDVVIAPTIHGVALAIVDKIDVKESELGFRAENIKKISEKIKSSTVDELVKKDKVKEIKAELDKKIKEIDLVEKYKMYASLSPEVAALIASLEEMSK